jgi:hypothetical protein
VRGAEEGEESVVVSHSRRGGNQSLHGNVHEAVVNETSGESGEASHGPMHSILSKEHAIECVTGIGGDRSTE